MKKLYIPLIIIVAAAAFAGGYFIPRSNKLESNDIQGEPSFTMSENLSCTILTSSSGDDINRKISFINLGGNEPKVLFSDTGATSPLTKVHTSDDTVTLQLVASGSGSTDTFVIDKKTGIFSRAAAGSFAGVYATASKGNCK